MSLTESEPDSVRHLTCSCAHNGDGSVTTLMCPVHASEDPCAAMARVTGKRRRGSVVRGLCTACGWSVATQIGSGS